MSANFHKGIHSSISTVFIVGTTANSSSSSSGPKRTDYFEDNDETFDSGQAIKSRVFTNRAHDRGRSFGGRGQFSGFGRNGPSLGDDGYQSSNRFSNDVELKISSGDVGRIIGVCMCVCLCAQCSHPLNALANENYCLCLYV